MFSLPGLDRARSGVIGIVEVLAFLILGVFVHGVCLCPRTHTFSSLDLHLEEVQLQGNDLRSSSWAA